MTTREEYQSLIRTVVYYDDDDLVEFSSIFLLWLSICIQKLSFFPAGARLAA